MIQLGQKLKQARESRGWTRYEACERTDGIVKWESLARLESGRTNPESMLLRTAMALIELYWPDIQITDLVGDEYGRYKLSRVGARKAKKR